MIIGQYQENTQRISQNQGNTCRYSSNFPSGNTQGIRSSDEDRTDCVFPPFNLPRRTQTIPKRSCLSLNVIFWSKIQSMGSRRQSEYSRAKYVALPVVPRRRARLAGRQAERAHNEMTGLVQLVSSRRSDAELEHQRRLWG